MKAIYHFPLGALVICTLCVMLDSCTKNLQMHVTAVNISATSMSMVVGEEKVLTATVSPSEADNKTIIWSTSNADVASVIDGKVTAISEGSARISAIADDGGFKAQCTVTVDPCIVAATGVSLSQSSATIEKGGTLSLVATVSPADATNSAVTWSSSAPNIAAVSKEGTVTAVAGGQAEILVKTDDGGFTAKCTIDVTVALEGIALDQTSATMEVGDEMTLAVSYFPEDATSRTLVWTSSNEDVVSVTDGTIKALKQGTATVMAKSEDGKVSAQCEITVITLGSDIKASALPLEMAGLYSNGLNTLVLEFTLETEATALDYELSVSDPSGISAQLEMDASGKAGHISVISTGVIENNCTISVKFNERGEGLTANWSEPISWTVEPARFNVTLYPYEGVTDVNSLPNKKEIYYGGVYCDFLIDTNVPYTVYAEDFCKDWVEFTPNAYGGSFGVHVIGSHDKENTRESVVHFRDEKDLFHYTASWVQDKEPAEGGYTDVDFVIIINPS